MTNVERVPRLESESLEDFARVHYCVTDLDGFEDAKRLSMVVQAVAESEAAGDRIMPDVPGAPLVRYRIDHPSEIPAAVQTFLPEVERDPKLHALSFVDPLAVANQLGIVVSPSVARVVRRGLASVVTFDQRSLDSEGRLRGQGTMRWRPKTLPGGDR
jgi:hypothetical protein